MKVLFQGECYVIEETLLKNFKKHGNNTAPKGDGNVRDDASEGDTLNEVISNVDHTKKNHKWKCTKSNDSKRKCDDTKHCPK